MVRSVKCLTLDLRSDLRLRVTSSKCTLGSGLDTEPALKKVLVFEMLTLQKIVTYAEDFFSIIMWA